MGNMPKWLKTTLICLCCAICLGGAFGLGYLVSNNAASEEIRAIKYIIQMYKQYYYEETDDIVGVFADSLLDDYSQYYTAEEYELIQKASSGYRNGIGVEQSGLYIVRVKGNSPAQNAGILGGDVIKSITYNGTKTECATVDEFIKVFDSIPDEVEFSMEVYRGEEVVSATLSRRSYVESTVWYCNSSDYYGYTNANSNMEMVRLSTNIKYKDIAADTAVIEFSHFNGDQNGLNGAVGQFKAALEKFKKEGKKKLIVDLRNNGGGSLDILSQVATHLLCSRGSNLPILVISDKYKNERVYYSGTLDYYYYGIEKTVYLANINTASASEALIGAALDYDASGAVNVVVEGINTSVGKLYRTYGKGIMQTTYPNIITGEAIKLTTAKIFWPKTRTCIHGVGITPETDGRVYAETEKGCVADAAARLAA